MYPDDGASGGATCRPFARILGQFVCAAQGSISDSSYSDGELKQPKTARTRGTSGMTT